MFTIKASTNHVDHKYIFFFTVSAIILDGGEFTYVIYIYTELNRFDT
jgi:hypothetical protein